MSSKENLDEFVSLLKRGITYKVIEFIESLNPTISNLIILLEKGLQAIGLLWSEETVSITQVYRASMIVEQIIDKFISISENSFIPKRKVLIGCIAQDSHNLGKDLVKRFLQPFFIVIDLGVNVSPEIFIKRAKEENVDIIAVSAVMLNAVRNIETLRGLIDHEEWVSKKPLLIVGGAPFLIDSQLWKRIGADAMVQSAIDAPEKFKILLKEKIDA